MWNHQSWEILTAQIIHWFILVPKNSHEFTFNFLIAHMLMTLKGEEVMGEVMYHDSNNRTKEFVALVNTIRVRICSWSFQWRKKSTKENSSWTSTYCPSIGKSPSVLSRTIWRQVLLIPIKFTGLFWRPSHFCGDRFLYTRDSFILARKRKLHHFRLAHTESKLMLILRSDRDQREKFCFCVRFCKQRLILNGIGFNSFVLLGH